MSTLTLFVFDYNYCVEPGLFCNKIGAGTHFQASGAENYFSYRLSQKIFTSQVFKKVDDLYLLFHYIFVYYPPLIYYSTVNFPLHLLLI